jgi:hypothetical protein
MVRVDKIEVGTEAAAWIEFLVDFVGLDFVGLLIFKFVAILSLFPSSVWTWRSLYWMRPKLFTAFRLRDDELVEEYGSRPSRNQAYIVLSSSLKPKTFCFVLTATATLESGFLANLGDLRGDSRPEVDDAGGDWVMVGTRRSTSGSTLEVGDDGDDGEGVILCLFFFSSVVRPSRMSARHVRLRRWELRGSVVGVVPEGVRGRLGRGMSISVVPEQQQQQASME